MASDIGSVTCNITNAIESANRSFENVWQAIAGTASSMGASNVSQFAARRLLSYNPQNRDGLVVIPEAQPGITKLCEIISKTIAEIQTDPNNLTKWILVGKCYLLLGDHPNAYSAFAHCLRIDQPTNDPYFWYSIACVYQHFHFNEDALKFFTKVLEVDPNFPLVSDYNLRIGLCFRALGRYQEAINAINIVMQHGPPSGLTEDDVAFQRIFTYQISGAVPRALQEYGELVQRYPENLKLIQQYVWALSFQSDSASLQTAERIIAGVPQYADDPLLKFVLARIALKNSDMETAYKRYCDCIGDWSESPIFWCGLGVLYFRNEQRQDALIAFQRALYLKPEIPEAWLNLGIIFENLDQTPNASKIYQAGRQNCPGNQKLQERIARLQAGGKLQRPATEVEEIKDSKFFVQVADRHAAMVTRTPPPLPGSAVSADPAIARAVDGLACPYESLFAEND